MEAERKVRLWRSTQRKLSHDMSMRNRVDRMPLVAGVQESKHMVRA